MPQKMYVVRVVQARDCGWIIESLRYAGTVRVHIADCFDIMPPRGIPLQNTAQWAEDNAKRMQTMGFNAVKAPEAFSGTVRDLDSYRNPELCDQLAKHVLQKGHEQEQSGTVD